MEDSELVEHQATVNGVRLNYVVAGHGMPVLLLHGFPDSWRLWRYQLPALTEAGYRVVAPDLRGFGNSDKPAGARAYRMKEIVADLRGLMDSLGISRFYVVGHDWGAIAAWAVAGQMPQRAVKLVAISVGHPRAFMEPSLEQIGRSWYALFFQVPGLPERALRTADWKLFRALFGSSPDFDRYLEELARPGALSAGLNWYRANGRPDRLLDRSTYPKVRCPTLGIWGRKDWALGERQMTASARYIAGRWRYEPLDAGHWIPLRRADELNRLLLGFFAPLPTTA